MQLEGVFSALLTLSGRIFRHFDDTEANISIRYSPLPEQCRNHLPDFVSRSVDELLKK